MTLTSVPPHTSLARLGFHTVKSLVNKEINSLLLEAQALWKEQR